jgi:hypothetical protein
VIQSTREFGNGSQASSLNAGRNVQSYAGRLRVPESMAKPSVENLAYHTGLITSATFVCGTSWRFFQCEQSVGKPGKRLSIELGFIIEEKMIGVGYFDDGALRLTESSQVR